MELILLIFAVGLILAFLIRHPIKSLKVILAFIGLFILGLVGLALFSWGILFLMTA